MASTQTILAQTPPMGWNSWNMFGPRISETAVALINRTSVGQDVTLPARNIGLLDTPKLARNLWQQTDTADFKEKLTLRVQPHETILLKITS